MRKSDYEISEIQKLINAHASDKHNAVQQYNRIPHVPLMMQREDWPLCCGDWCEFVGFPPITTNRYVFLRKINSGIGDPSSHIGILN